jgi:hypothetical protein
MEGALREVDNYVMVSFDNNMTATDVGKGTTPGVHIVLSHVTEWNRVEQSGLI